MFISKRVSVIFVLLVQSMQPIWYVVMTVGASGLPHRNHEGIEIHDAVVRKTDCVILVSVDSSYGTLCAANAVRAAFQNRACLVCFEESAARKFVDAQKRMGENALYGFSHCPYNSL